MPRLDKLQVALKRPPTSSSDHFDTPEGAWALLRSSGLPERAVRDAALGLIARELAPQLSDVQALLTALTATLASPKPERDLVELLARLSGGQAALTTAWGERLAHSGPLGGDVLAAPIIFEGRLLGTLHLAADAGWAPLLGLAAGVARLALLGHQTRAAAGRRAAERALAALLAGDAAGAFPLAEDEPLAAAVLALPDRPRAGPRHDLEASLDLLLAAGDAEFQARGLAVVSGVCQDRAVWLFHGLDLAGAARALHAAVLAATPHDLRLGVGGPQPGRAGARQALVQAEQALGAARTPRALALHADLDPLDRLFDRHPELLAELRAALHARLAPFDRGGKLRVTLRAYLSGGSQADLAARLEVHPNTLRYRLRRAEELLGVSLADPATLARLYLGLGGPDPARRQG